MSSALLIVAGLAGLLLGADLLVRGGSALATHLGVRPIVIGLTVVALGTSLPELAIGIDAVREESPGLAVGNIVGTNLVNILFILGLSALILPIAFERRTLRFDLPAMTAACLGLWLLALDGSLSRVDGTILCVGGVAYTAGIIWTSRRESASVAADYESHAERTTRRGLLLRGLALIAGIGLVLAGAEFLVDGAIDVARSLEVSEATIGLTVIAIGTSAPELVTTLTSTLRGDREIAVGNLLGSTVYNVALILGITVLVAPTELEVQEEVIAADLLVLAVVAVVTVPVLLSGHRISRLEGGAFVAAYLGYLVWLTLF
ncbi:MAG TPA: calcium/sodium antiporter [Solirubrobacteraceae bacterium]|nr:calcium/sodium antiporter [Solirubrobacteraceae bacterium]